MPRIIPRSICNSTTNWVKSNYCNCGTRTDIDDLAVDISKWTGNPTSLKWSYLKINDDNVPNGLIHFHQSNSKHQRLMFPSTNKPNGIVDIGKFVFDFNNRNSGLMPEWEGWHLFVNINCDKLINVKLNQEDGVDNFSNSMFEPSNNGACKINKVYFAEGFNKIKVTSGRQKDIKWNNNGALSFKFTQEFYNLDLSLVPDNYLFTNFNYVTWADFKHCHCNLNISTSLLERDAILHIFNNCIDKITTTKTLTLGSTLLAKLTDEDKKIATDKGWTLA